VSIISILGFIAINLCIKLKYSPTKRS
jgi:hypothetical protein